VRSEVTKAEGPDNSLTDHSQRAGGDNRRAEAHGDGQGHSVREVFERDVSPLRTASGRDGGTAAARDNHASAGTGSAVHDGRRSGAAAGNRFDDAEGRDDVPVRLTTLISNFVKSLFVSEPVFVPAGLRDLSGPAGWPGDFDLPPSFEVEAHGILPRDSWLIASAGPEHVVIGARADRGFVVYEKVALLDLPVFLATIEAEEEAVFGPGLTPLSRVEHEALKAGNPLRSPEV